MNIERDNDMVDQLVAQTYRDNSNEQAPDSLNQRILKMAADDARPSGALAAFFNAWTKPLAWAATIGLSLAIVLEISQVAHDPLSRDVPAAESVSDEFVLKNSSQFDDARNQAQLRAGPSEVGIELLEADPVESAELEAPKQALANATPAAKSVAVTNTAADTDAAEFEKGLADRNAVQNDAPATAAQMPAARALPAIAVAAEKKASAESAGCSESVRETASDWLACIEALRLAGADDVANREHEEFVLRFPLE